MLFCLRASTSLLAVLSVSAEANALEAPAEVAAEGELAAGADAVEDVLVEDQADVCCLK